MLDTHRMVGRRSGAQPIVDSQVLHVINVDDPGQIDGEVLGWLTEAYHFAGGTLGGEGAGGSGVDPMVPDDVDDPFT